MTKDALAAGTVSSEVQDAVAGVVKSLEQAFNTKDAVALGAQFTDSASWTNARGTRLDGRSAIVEFSAPAMEGFLREAFARYEVVRMLEIAPGVIGVNVVQTPIDRAGARVDGPWGATLYVVVKEIDGWRIAAGQNMPVDPPPTP
ncbi:SgcJ/EcaC family oxidoreductase [Streptomyces sp. NPDC047023]|uniref:SgcJ/EcaC family oxidoreductase n=1 Tax=Streptomyces sp. NPDC047023 TaxID=3155139 RepID=UPI0033DCE4CC